MTRALLFHFGSNVFGNIINSEIPIRYQRSDQRGHYESGPANDRIFKDKQKEEDHNLVNEIPYMKSISLNLLDAN